MRPNISIRVDGNNQIGLGHFVRCSALAHMLKEEFEIIFFCRHLPEPLLKELKSSGISFHRIKNDQEFPRQLTINDIAVLDGYNFDTNYQKNIKASGAKLVCIDDLHNKEFVADLIINHAPKITTQEYKGQHYTKYALGLEYALLRPFFLQQAKEKREIETIETLLICFGGSDPQNLTLKTLLASLIFNQIKKIIIITGSEYQFSDSLKPIVLKDRRIDHRYSLNEQKMLEAMLESDLAIVPASGILFEALAAGCLTISGCYVDNQNENYKGFKGLGLIGDAHKFERTSIESAINKMFQTPIKDKQPLDGYSGMRIKKLFRDFVI